MKNLFNFTNAKTVKGEKLGYRTAILYLAPHKMNGMGIDLCEHSTLECRIMCLNTAGLAGVFKSIQESRIKKTRWMLKHPALFWSRIDVEITNHENLTHRQQTRLKRKFKPCVRLNGTSDIWNTDMETIMYRHPDTQFYDYSKDFNRIVDYAMGKLPINYHLTYSYSGGPTNAAMWCIDMGVNVAVVFDVKRGKPLPDTHWGIDVVDGDKHDLRFLNKSRDKRGVIIGLRAKGKAIGVISKENSFVQSGSTEVQS
jgi:hypothetical protein